MTSSLDVTVAVNMYSGNINGSPVPDPTRGHGQVLSHVAGRTASPRELTA